ncbi:NAD-dependent epimerase/dehydratase family protein, partial [Corynebacterium casei]
MRTFDNSTSSTDLFRTPRVFQRMLVTGGAGFIGANFVRLVEQEWPQCEVVVIDKLTYAGNRENLAGTKAKLVEGDINDAQLVDDLVGNTDVIVHFA